RWRFGDELRRSTQNRVETSGRELELVAGAESIGAAAPLELAVLGQLELVPARLRPPTVVRPKIPCEVRPLTGPQRPGSCGARCSARAERVGPKRTDDPGARARALEVLDLESGEASRSLADVGDARLDCLVWDGGGTNCMRPQDIAATRYVRVNT